MSDGRSWYEWRLIVHPFGEKAYPHEAGYKDRPSAISEKMRIRRALPSATVDVVQVKCTEIVGGKRDD